MEMKFVKLRLIQIGIITLFVGVGCCLGVHEYLKNNKLFVKVIASVFLGIGAIMCIPLVIIYRFLKSEFESKWWYIYYII